MEPQVVLGLIAGCAALVGVLAFLSLHILRAGAPVSAGTL